MDTCSSRIERSIHAGESYQSIINCETTFSGRSTKSWPAMQRLMELAANPLAPPPLRPLSSYGVQQIPSERAQLLRKWSNSSINAARPTAVKVTRGHDDIPESSSSAYVPPSFNDDDEFYIMYLRRDHGSPGSLKQVFIEALSLDHPGIFNDLADVSDLFQDPVRYQPLAKRIRDPEWLRYVFENDDRPTLWRSEKTTYGVYKHGCYKTVKDGNGRNHIEIDHDRYSAIKKKF